MADRVQVFALNKEDIPKIFKKVPGHSFPGVRCMVCSSYIDITGKERQYIIKCLECSEATPMREPPGDDKKFVRCPCNCLLICGITALRVVCPRQSCQRVLDIIKPIKPRKQSTKLVGTVRVTCYYCGRRFLFNTLRKGLARCSHCRKRTAIGKEFSSRWTIICCVIGSVLFIISICITVGTRHVINPGLDILYVALFTGTFLMFMGALFFYSIKTSEVVSPFSE